MEKYNLPFVVVFIPAYCEEGSIQRVIDLTRSCYKNQAQHDYALEIIVINDGSKDDTVKASKDAGVKRVVSHPFNRGLGAATRTGMQTALEMGADIAVKIDADFQHDPEDIDKVIRPILEDRADCVFGTRFMGGLNYKMPIHRDLGNKFFSWLTGKITGLKITDGQTGLMAFHKRYLQVFNIIKDYNETQQLIIDSWGKHMRVMEVPVVFHKRTTGKSFISWKYPFIVLPNMLRLYIHFKPLRFFLFSGSIITMLGFIGGILLLLGYELPFGDATVSTMIIVGFQIMFFGILADQINFKR